MPSQTTVKATFSQAKAGMLKLGYVATDGTTITAKVSKRRTDGGGRAAVAEGSGLAPPEGATLREGMRHKLRTEVGRSIYNMRKAIGDSVFRHNKERRGVRRFSLRGVGNVRLEWQLICLTGNLLKPHRWESSPQTA